MTAVLGLVLAVMLAASPDTVGYGQVEGEVRAEGSAAPLAGVSVEAVGGGVRRVARSDSEGRYRLENVPAGKVTVQVRQIGYETLRLNIVVPAGGLLGLDLSLLPRPVSLAGVDVDGEIRGPPRDTTEAAENLDMAQLRHRTMEMPPGIAEMGLGEGYQGPPGQAPIDPGDVLYVRGAAERKAVLLDGAPIYTPFHLGGLLEPFEADVLAGAALYLGGAPARYDGGLSYILDLQTRPGRADRARTSGSLDLMSGRLMSEGGMGDRMRFRVAGRAIHGLGVRPFAEGDFPYDYADGLARADLIVGGGVLSMTGFGNREGVHLASAARDSMRAGWANLAGSVRYARTIGGTETTLGVAGSTFGATLPAPRNGDPAIRGETDRLRVTADMVREAGALRLGFGTSIDRTEMRYRTDREANAHASVAAQAATSAGAYLDGGWRPSARLRLRGGVRADLFGGGEGARLAPRLSASWMLSERAAVTASVGRYHQLIRDAQLTDLIEHGDTTPRSMTSPSLLVGSATHTALSLHQALDNEVRLGVEGFFKTFEHAAPSIRRSHASGVDLWVRRDEGPVRAYAGYSLSWVWAATSGTAQQFAGRQLINAGAIAPLPGDVELETRFSFGTGLPFTAIPLAADAEFRSPTTLSGTRSASDTPPLPMPIDDVHLRLDLGLSRSFTPQWRGRATRITPYIRVLNALDQRQGNFYRGGPADPEVEPVATLPLIPLVGLRWTF